MPSINNIKYRSILDDVKALKTDDLKNNKRYIKVDLARDTIEYTANQAERSSLKDVNLFVARHLTEITKNPEASQKLHTILSDAKVRIINRSSRSIIDWVMNFIYTLVLVIIRNSKSRITNNTQYLIDTIIFENKFREIIKTSIEQNKIQDKEVQKFINKKLNDDLKDIGNTPGLVHQFKKDSHRGHEFIITDRTVSIDSFKTNIDLRDKQSKLPSSNFDQYLKRKLDGINSVLISEEDKKWNLALQSLLTQTTTNALGAPLRGFALVALAGKLSAPKIDNDIYIIKANIIRDTSYNITEIQFTCDVNYDCYSDGEVVFKDAVKGSLAFKLKLDDHDQPYVDDLTTKIEY